MTTEALDNHGASATNHARKIVTVLEAIAASQGPLGVRELGRQTGLDKTSASRVLRQLLEMGIVEADEDRQGSYCIGARLFALANQISARDEVISAARPFLLELVQKFDETTYLTLLEDGQAVYRDVVESGRTIRYVARLNEPFPLATGASGRALLFDADPDTIDAYGKATRRGTTQSPGRQRGLRAQIEHDRRNGYAVSIGERTPDGAAVAVPLQGHNGRILGALTVAFPVSRLDEHSAQQIGECLMNVAGRLSHRLGKPAR